MMGEDTVGRRQLLRGAGIAAASGVVLTGMGAGSASASGDGGDHAGLTGSWLVTRRDDGAPTTTLSTASFTAGWVFNSNDIDPAGPTAFGTWAHGEDGAFKATFWQGLGGDGQPNPTVQVRVSGRLARATISGTYTAKFFDPSGKHTQTGTGAFTGKRIHA